MHGVRFPSPEAAVENFSHLLEEVPPTDWSSLFNKWFNCANAVMQLDANGVFWENVTIILFLNKLALPHPEMYSTPFLCIGMYIMCMCVYVYDCRMYI